MPALDPSAALSLHASRLIGQNFRRALASELRKLPDQAAQPRHRLDAGVAICRQGVLNSVGLVEELAARLEDPEPLDARGVAHVRALLRGGDSPLFDPHGADGFMRALGTALEALEPRVSV